MSGQEFNRDTAGAKKAAAHGPVFITDRGQPSHVLLTIADYRRLNDGESNIVDRLRMPAGVEAELAIPRRRDLARAADLG